MKILLSGLCTVHFGRIENGNIGNYYIVEATVRELHRVFPEATIATTFQLTDEFCQNEKIIRLPMEMYYSWLDTDLDLAQKEYAAAIEVQQTGVLNFSSPWLETIKSYNLICDFSGEMWGDHAEPVGRNRFEVNLLKFRTAQLLGIKTALLAGSQGPFKNTAHVLELAKEVYKNFNYILNREHASIELLESYGFDISKSKSFTDPAFLFEPEADSMMSEIFSHEFRNNACYLFYVVFLNFSKQRQT